MSNLSLGGDRGRRLLLDHGTRAILLKPSSVLAAAEEDLRRYVRNRDRDCVGAEHYAFHRYHVRKAAKCDFAIGKDVIEYALANLALGLESGKHNTRVLYGDEALLRAALLC